jgi:hypothetical protein
MMRTLFHGILGLFCGAASICAGGEGTMLVRIPLSENPANVPLPIYAHQQDGAGGGYVLAKASLAELEAAGRPYEVLDSQAYGARYVRANYRSADVRAATAGRFQVLWDDGRRLWIKARSEGEAAALSEMRFETGWLPERPLNFDEPRFRLAEATAKAAMTASPLVQEMLARVSTNTLAAAMNELTGPAPTVADGSYTNIRTRYTSSGRPVLRATAYMGEYFSALGYDTRYQSWSANGYSSRNVVATLPGTTSSSQIVVVCAHVDCMPSGPTAFGADDNASGALAVLTAAELFRDFRFEKTVRFVVFTGEEQGLFGSAAYAAAAAAAGDNITAALNFDMIAWDSNGDGQLRLHTRQTSNSGYAGDRAIAATFTNILTVYGISNLAPIITTDGDTESDHSSFWDEGYPSIMAIEEDWVDFNSYYHTTNDTADKVNWSYYARFVKAGVATAAHLAVPVDRAPYDAIRIVSGPFATTSTVGHGTFVASHRSGAQEGDDAWDSNATNAPAAYMTNRLALRTRPGATNLYRDARPADSETIFSANLAAVHTNATLTTTNRLRFDFIGGTDTNGAYLVRIDIPGQYLVGGTSFACVTNLRELVVAGGFLALPASVQTTNGAVYGTCEIRKLGVERAASLIWDATDPSNIVLKVEGPPGIQTADAVEWSDTFTNWTRLATTTNRVAVDSNNFDSGEKPVSLGLPNPPPAGTPRFYRLQRRWLSP